ncbi:MoaD family protein [Candidatus Bathyarchaeota archaeon]|nr:MoaD family protein [Candidatus Bathyarchaeota archaeon]NIU81721.1 MoaD family protein [Candidatus Bathyarchaeota archaeon]NIV68037.1 MoaD family protein [Candidatus Bathyarchaeota archaeon]NIW16446.1 MoaD family protein [Candidatus Bathyarchaeota archaeon]NIW34566.1 MoaD family protein [Candidatus Bathyarchaeota archaeon]
MARVQVKYFTVLREITGKREEVMEAETIRELLDLLISKYGKPLQDEVNSDREKIPGYYNILVNGLNVRLLKNLETSLKDGYVISILPPVGGG